MEVSTFTYQLSRSVRRPVVNHDHFEGRAVARSHSHSPLDRLRDVPLLIESGENEGDRVPPYPTSRRGGRILLLVIIEKFNRHWLVPPERRMGMISVHMKSEANRT